MVEYDVINENNIDIESVSSTSSIKEPIVHHGQNANWVTAMHMFISFIGAGILGLPYAFMKAGVLGSCIILMGTGIISTYSMMILVKCKRKLESLGIEIHSYGDIGKHVFGESGSKLIDGLVVFTQVSFCCAYLIFIGQNLGSLSNHFTSTEFIWILAPGLMLMALLRQVKQLTPCSFIADVCNVIGILTVIVADWYHLPEYSPIVINENFTNANFQPRHVSDVSYGIIWTNVIYFFGIAVYCYEGVGVIVHIEHSMKNKEHFESLLMTNMTVVTLIYIIFGVFGYLAFEGDTREIVTLNLGHSLGTLMVKVALSIGLYFTYPLMMFPVNKVLESTPCMADRHIIFKHLMRCGVVFFSVVVAVVVPNFGDFVALVGAFACSSLALIIPALLHSTLFDKELRRYEFILDRVIIFCGALFAATGTVNAAMAIFAKM